MTSKRNKFGLPAKSSIAIAVYLASNIANASSTNRIADNNHQWLANSAKDQYTIQLATIYGHEKCQAFAKKVDFESAHCFESSSTANRWYVVAGQYSNMKAAADAAKTAGIDKPFINSIDRIKQNQCEAGKTAAWCESAPMATTKTDESPATKDTVERVEPIAAQQPIANQTQLAEETAKAAPASDEKQVDEKLVFKPRECKPEQTTKRRRPGYPVLVYDAEDCNPDRLSAPRPSILPDPAPVPDRWRIVESLGYPERLWDPYNGNNPLKGDKPIFGKPGKEWFFNLSAISDTVYEPRRFQVPVGAATTRDPGQLDLIGKGDQYLVNQNLITELVLYRGDTVFRPPDHEFRLITVFNVNHTVVDERGLLKADPAQGTTRTEEFIGIQGAFWDYHIRNVSDRYDFDSFRIGVQPFSSDFRGFLFQDNQFGIRFFGTRDNNIFQYNLAWFRRMEKEINSGLNDISDPLRDDDVFIANLYWQDFPRLGFVSQASVIHNRNREADDFYFDDNQFIARPSSLGFERGRDYDVTYLGISGDGHFGRNNLTYSAYYATGDQSNGVFTNESTDISAYFLAAELSRDYDWIRARASLLHSSGDSNPLDRKENGFDAIFENPQFAGGDTAFFIRQGVPLIGGGRVAINSRNSIIPSLRSSKELGQSNFTNPGITLLGLGADLDLTPETRLSFNFNQMWFDDTASLELARNQTNIDKNIGQDLSAALIWRPLASQNAVFRLSGAVLNPGSGYKDLFGERKPYSILANLILAY